MGLRILLVSLSVTFSLSTNAVQLSSGGLIKTLSPNERRMRDRVDQYYHQRAAAYQNEMATASALQGTYALGSTWTPDMIVSPDMVTDGNGVPIPAFLNYIQGHNNRPLIWALENTGSTASGYYGRKILLRPGFYSHMEFKPSGSGQFVVNRLGSSESNPVEVRGEEGAIIEKSTWSHTIFVSGGSANHDFNHLIWNNVDFQVSGSSAIHIGANSDGVNGIKYTGWHFIGCKIDGLYNHVTESGHNSKWGFLTYGLDDFVFQFGEIFNIKREHAFYFHNSAGDVRIRWNLLYHLGRTAFQATARLSESGFGPLPPNPGKIVFENNLISDTGISPPGWDNCAGGQSITITGRNEGTIQVQDNIIAHGYDLFAEGLRDAKEESCGGAIGMGSFVSWTTNTEDYQNSGAILFRDNYISYHPDTGIRTAVSVSAVDAALITGNFIQTGLSTQDALILSKSGNPSTHPLPGMYIDPSIWDVVGEGEYCVKHNTLVGGLLKILGVPVSQPQWDGALGQIACN